MRKLKDNEINFETIYDKLDFDEKTLKKIKEAYLYAVNEYAGKKRLSGADYITHPLNVTNILTDLNVDDTTIIASLLHDVLDKGTSATKEDLKEK